MNTAVSGSYTDEPLEPLEDSADAAVLDTPVEAQESEEAIASLPPGARDVLVTDEGGWP